VPNFADVVIRAADPGVSPNKGGFPGWACSSRSWVRCWRGA